MEDEKKFDDFEPNGHALNILGPRIVKLLHNWMRTTKTSGFQTILEINKGTHREVRAVFMYNTKEMLSIQACPRCNRAYDIEHEEEFKQVLIKIPKGYDFVLYKIKDGKPSQRR